ncbi:MAG: hypothetical protein IOC90_07190 [Methylocystis sp.]|nr:hypothetical protein [Methylocystis sp.]MCA3585316.1 hypothetical protein [Methylocystis sp.]MCA3587804.1 hypothetical protein [Methylocystis sp.]MCA3593195.1 hypothetical protein [Methylocystis sp.]
MKLLDKIGGAGFRVALGTVVFAGMTATASARSDTEIANRGKDRVGLISVAMPYGSVAAHGSHIGYNLHLTNKVSTYPGIPGSDVRVACGGDGGGGD